MNKQLVGGFEQDWWIRTLLGGFEQAVN